MKEDILSVITNLPTELISLIKEYLKPNTRLLANKHEYKLYHNIVVPKFLNISYHNYILKIFSKDYDFIFNVLLNDNSKKWINIKKFRYEGDKFNNYLYFLLYLSSEKRALKCNKLIQDYIYVNVYVHNTGSLKTT
jgi:hypothetical protein